MTKKTPAWLTLSADRVTVTLSKPTELNSVMVDTITMRSPTVRDIRVAQRGAGDDDEQRELNLFASLAEVSAKELEGMDLKDYTRLQTAYFRLVQDDDV
ncbi:phage tail assembly protein [Pseudomonas inefficax]|uniref:phage tail assembly protein n=1 Tax=Pseudomonas inefficax TaxID=2078786 RepID=UPI0028BD2E40|nr:phage tail assembly protein [Pseudomonas inefficax]WNN38501.1 phage tail assembly protein [Pseudomonas inefficax]